jgi:ankyrin repeat protein
MKKIIICLATVLILVLGNASFGQNISEEARRHFDRGVTALKMANSTAECKPAIEELEQAARLAPDWPDAFYNLGLAQEKAERFKDAVASYKQYLRLAPNADDAEEVKSLINGLEYKAENVLTADDITDVLLSLEDTIEFAATNQGRKTDFFEPKDLPYLNILWEYQGDLCFWLGAGMSNLQRRGNDLIAVLGHQKPLRGEIDFQQIESEKKAGTYRDKSDRQILKVTGPILKYIQTINNCDEAVERNRARRGEGSCETVIEHEIEVVSRKLVKITQTILRNGYGGGPGLVGKRTGDVLIGVFRKKDRAGTGDLSLNARLLEAVLLGDKDKMELLIAKGANVNARYKDKYGKTMLNVAAESARTEMAELLIAQGADINATDDSGNTPLHSTKSSEMAELLIAKGADANAKNNDGSTPLSVAKMANNIELAALLETHAGDFRKKDTAGTHNPALVAKLQQAVLHGNKEEAERLIAQGADINAKFVFGTTLLHLATSLGSLGNEVAKLLIAQGADINAKENISRFTPLHFAVRENQKDVAQLLIAKGADVNAKNNIGETPLQLAEKSGFNEMADLLKKHGAR